jgi:hypothetical protein
MAVIQTAADPPNHGRIILAIMGWIWNSRNALRNMVEAERIIASGDYSTSGEKTKQDKHTHNKKAWPRQGQALLIAKMDRFSSPRP